MKTTKKVYAYAKDTYKDINYNITEIIKYDDNGDVIVRELIGWDGPNSHICCIYNGGKLIVMVVSHNGRVYRYDRYK